MLRGWGGGLLAAVVVACLSFGTVRASAQGTQGSDTEAHALFVAGQVAYDEGRYESALQDFQRAYELSGRAELLFNIGAAAEHVRHDAEALAAYERYLAERPDAPNRTVVEARLAVLRRAIAEHTTTPPTDAPPIDTTPPESTPAPAEPPPTSAGPGVAPWIVLGVGAAVAVAGAVLIGVGYGDIDRVQSAHDAYWTDVSGAYADAPVLTGVGFAMLGVGAAAAIGGLVWALVAPSGGGATASRAAPRLSGWAGPGGGGLSLGGSF